MFTWIPAYEQIANRLLNYENNQPALVTLLQNIGITQLNDKDSADNLSLLQEIDPFTFVCYLNKYGDDKRLQFLQAICQEWSISPVPTDVSGIPNVNAQKVWLFGYKKDRLPTDIPLLWEFFKALLSDTITNDLFNRVLAIRNVGKQKITEVMFIFKPEKYLCLNGVVKPYLQQKNLPTDFSSYTDYTLRIEHAKSQLQQSFPKISYDAWLQANGKLVPVTNNTPAGTGSFIYRIKTTAFGGGDV